MVALKISRTWAMPTKDTFDCKPIGEFVWRYLDKDLISIDPFARNKGWATYTNDLNPETSAQYHMDARDFLQKIADDGIRVELIIFDPPYSLVQLKRSYNSIGLKMTLEDGWRPGRWSAEKNLCNRILKIGGLFLHFGWNTTGMGKGRGFEPIELLVVCHGPGHNDTLCLAEKKMRQQLIMEIE